MPTKKTQTPTKPEYIHAVGRRKRAIARVRLYHKTTKDNNVDITVNGLPVGQYFTIPNARLTYAKPLQLTDTLAKYSVTAKIVGSGPSSQLGAMLHGIARALVVADETYRPVLKKQGLLTRDPRKRERRKIGTGGKARAKKQSPKR